MFDIIKVIVIIIITVPTIIIVCYKIILVNIPTQKVFSIII